jgi:hypothetical protein
MEIMKIPETLQPIEKDDRLQNFIELMNWAFLNKNDYIYNRAMKNVFDLLNLYGRN